jgi:enoyl-CoA hydratase/carnithine racemase
LQIGLVQEVVPAGQQIARASEIAHRIARNAPVGIRAMKEAALKFIQAGEAMAIAGIPAIHAAVMGTEDAKEGIRSFVERREAQFQGR